MTSCSMMLTLHTTPGVVVISSYSVSRSGSRINLESRIPARGGTRVPAGNEHAPATTGPARGPRPASSMPITWLYPDAHFDCSKLRPRPDELLSPEPFLLGPAADPDDAVGGIEILVRRGWRERAGPRVQRAAQYNGRRENAEGHHPRVMYFFVECAEKEEATSSHHERGSGTQNWNQGTDAATHRAPQPHAGKIDRTEQRSKSDAAKNDF